MAKKIDFDRVIPQTSIEARKFHLHNRLSASLETGFSQYPFLGRVDYDSQNRTLDIIAQTLLETSIMLHVPIPPVNFVLIPKSDTTDFETDARIIGNSRNNSLRMEIDLLYFLTQADLIRSSNGSESEKQLKKGIAHEMYHVRVERNYPQTDLVTQFANDIDGDAYLRDRGERVANAFGTKYAYGILSTRRLAKAG